MKKMRRKLQKKFLLLLTLKFFNEITFVILCIIEKKCEDLIKNGMNIKSIQN
jgi:hypothetical protein